MMKTLRNKILLPVLGTLMASASAQASLMVESIDLTMVSTTFDSRTDIPSFIDGIDALAAGYALTAGFGAALLDPAGFTCQESLDSFEGITTRGTCGGTRSDNGTLFSISGTVSGPTQMQFGLDWGRGGFSFLTLGENTPQIERYNDDIWWGNNWNNSDVLNFVLPESGEFLLIGLGFEGCCDGSNSARWRSLGATQSSAPGAWQTLAVNVPNPGVAPLMGLGLAGLMLARRRKTDTVAIEES